MASVITAMMIIIIVMINAHCHNGKRCKIRRIIVIIIRRIIRHINRRIHILYYRS